MLIINDIKAVTLIQKQSNVTAFLPAPTGKLTVEEGFSMPCNEITDTL